MQGPWQGQGCHDSSVRLSHIPGMGTEDAQLLSLLILDYKKVTPLNIIPVSYMCSREG